MPRVVRKYEHRDFSALQEELRRGGPEASRESGMPEETESKAPVNVVSEAKRKRDSLMHDPQMRYIHSKKSKVFHDRDCPNAESIPDEHFRMCREFPVNRKPCKQCYRKALIRAGLTEDFKRIGAYERVFDLLGAETQDLHTLLIKNGAVLYGAGSDYVCIRLREDRWIIRARQSACELYHNNYTISQGYERIFIKGFHLQQYRGKPIFRNFVRILTEYSWEDHRKAMMERDRAHRIQHLRQELAGMDIHLREPRFSLLFLYFTFIDCDEKAAQHFRECGLSPRIFTRENRKGTPFSIVFCRIPRWREKRFLTAMERLKETAALSEQTAYPGYCREALHEGE